MKFDVIFREDRGEPSVYNELIEADDEFSAITKVCNKLKGKPHNWNYKLVEVWKDGELSVVMYEKGSLKPVD